MCHRSASYKYRVRFLGNAPPLFFHHLISSRMMDLQGKTRSRLVYLPGIDGTGRLLFRQRRLFEEYDVRCVGYPQDRPSTYAELAALGEEQLLPEGGIVLAESFGGAVALT